MAEVKLQLGIKFLDKDIEVSAITKKVQQAINAAIAKTNLKQLKKQFEQLQTGIGDPGAAARVRKETVEYEKQTQRVRDTSRGVEQLARAKRQAENLRVFGTKEVQILNSAQLNMRELQQTFEKGGVSAAQFGMRIGEIAKRFSGFFIWTAALFKLLDAIRATTEALKELDNTAISIEKVLRDRLTKPVGELQTELINLADATNRRFSEVADAMTGFIRTGISVEESISATRAAMDLLNVSTVDATTAQKLLTTTVNSMGVSWEEAGEKVAVFSDLADRNAVVVKDLAQGFIRSGAAASALGVSTEELASMLATVTGATQISANRVGTAMRTILSGVGKAREEIIRSIAAYTQNGTALSTLNQQYNSVSKTLNFVAESWEDLNEKQRLSIVQLIGGSRRFTQFAALMDNNAKFQENLAAATAKTNSVQEKSEIQARSLEAAHNQLNNAITRFAKLLQDIGATDIYKNLVRGVASLVGGFVDVINFAEGISEEIGKISPLIGGITSAFGALKNVVIVLFAQLLIPKIREAYKGFITFITGSKAGMEKLLGIENTREIAASATQQAYQSQNATLQTQISLLEKANALQSGRAATPTTTATGTGGIQTATVTGGGGVSAAAQKLNMLTKQLDSSLNKIEFSLSAYNKQTLAGVKTSALAAKQTAILGKSAGTTSNVVITMGSASKTAGMRIIEMAGAAKKATVEFLQRARGRMPGADKLKQDVTGVGGALRGLAKNVGVQTVAMIGAMQVLDGFSNSLAQTAEGLQKEGDYAGAALATAGSNISRNLALAAPFGPAAWAAAVAMGGVQTAANSVTDAFEAVAALKKQETEAAANVVDAHDAVALAQHEYAVAQGLVNKGMARWVKTMDLTGKEITRRLEIDLGKIPVRISAEVLRTAGLEQTKKDMNDLILQAEDLRARWEQTKFEIDNSQAALRAFHELQKNVNREELKMELEFESKNFGKVSKEVGDFRKALLELETSQITVKEEGVSESLERINRLLDTADIKFVRIDEQIGSWKESMEVTSPRLEDMRGRLDAMSAEARKVKTEFDLMAASLAQTTAKGEVKLVDVRGVQSLKGALEDARKAAEATGEALTTTEVEDIRKKFQDIAKLTGGEIPKNINEQVTLFTKFVKLGDRSTTMMDLLRASGVEINKEVAKLVEAGEKQLKFTSQLAEAQKELRTEHCFICSSLRPENK
jgi:TP901 family phage tail tape measure protein